MGVRSIYASRMSAQRRELLEAEVSEEDRFDLSTEMATLREFLAHLFLLEKKVEEKHPDRPDMTLPIKQQQVEAIEKMARTYKVVREVETAGTVYNDEKIAGLINQIASLVTYHVTNELEKVTVLNEIQEYLKLFQREGAQGTLVTPEQDALMMDATVPGKPEDFEEEILCLEQSQPPPSSSSSSPSEN